jgi:hypothetical protein
VEPVPVDYLQCILNVEVRGTRSRVLKAGQQLGVMAHDEIKARSNLSPAHVALQDNLGTLQEQPRLGGMFLGCELLQPTIEVFRDAEIHGHAPMVQKRYKESAADA